MKRETAIRYAHEIARRVHAVNGLLATPGCEFEAVRIRRIWVFGSTVKGKQNPNDLDVLIDMQYAGRYRVAAKSRYAKIRTTGQHALRDSLCDGQIDKEYKRRNGWITAKSSKSYALIWLTKGMKMVSRHTLMNEAAAPFAEQVLIYPRFDMKTN